MNIHTLGKYIYRGVVLAFIACTLTSCLWWSDGSDSTSNDSQQQQVQFDARKVHEIRNMAVALEMNLYGANATSYDPANPTLGPATTYWATALCGQPSTANRSDMVAALTSCSTKVNDKSVVDPGNLTCDGKTCTESVAGNLQDVEFVTGVFASLGSNYTLSTVPGNGKDFWSSYQSQGDWHEFQPSDIGHAQEDGPRPGDIVSFSNDKDARGHVAIVVGSQPPTGSADGYVIVAGANQVGNLSGNDLSLVAAPRGNFYKIVWHTTDYVQNGTDHELFSAWANTHIQGFIRRINFQHGTQYEMAAPVASVIAIGTTGQTNGLSGTWPALNADPYQDPILKKLLATSQFQSSDVRTLVQDAWNVAVRFGIPPEYFILQVDEESSFNVGESTLGAHGLIQITSDALHLVGTDGESDSSVIMPNCVFDPNASADCMDTEANMPPMSESTANSNPLYNLEIGARTMLDKLIYNLAPVAQRMNELTLEFQQSGRATVPMNAKVQACMTINFNFTANPDCLEGLARALVSYNGGQSVVNGYKNRAMDNSCVPYLTSDPHQWLLCVWHNQDHRDPNDSNDGNHPDTAEWVHEAGRYVINIFDYLPNHQSYCEGDSSTDRVQQPCLDDVNRYPAFL